jgi:hypothetical protein
MQTYPLAMRTMTALGLTAFLAACDPQISETVVLDALKPPLFDLGLQVQRVDDDELTAAYRNLAATLEAGIGR